MKLRRIATFRPFVIGLTTVTAVSLIALRATTSSAIGEIEDVADTVASTVPRTTLDPKAPRPKPSYDKLTEAAPKPNLTVVFAAPRGKLKSTSDASEIRWLFDRPVVEFSSDRDAPDPKDFVALVTDGGTPVPGTFRWASTRMLTFQPTRVVPSTGYTASIRNLKALDGTVVTAHDLRFSTPTVTCEAIRQTVESVGGNFLVKCDQAIDVSSLGANTTIEYRRINVATSRYRPSAADLAIMKTQDPRGTQRLLDYLDNVVKRNRIVATQKVSATETPCSDDSPEICYRLQHGLAPLDAVASLRFGAGIRSLEGPLLSTAYSSGRYPTARTPMIVGRTCVKKCDPGAGASLDSIGLTPSDVSAIGAVRVVDTVTGSVQTFDGADANEYSALGFGWAKIAPMRTYRFEIGPEVVDADSGLALGYTSITTVSFGRASSLAQVQGGELVIEPDSKGVRLFSRNVSDIDKIERRIGRKDLAKFVRTYVGFPESKPLDLNDEKSRVTKLLLRENSETRSILKAGGKGNTGVYLVAARPRTRLADSHYAEDGAPWTSADQEEVDRRRAEAASKKEGTGAAGDGWSSTLVQRTDLGVTLKTSPANIFVAVTSLRTGTAVEGARVALYANNDDTPFFEKRTDKRGFVTATAESLASCNTCEVVAVVDLDDDVAYAQSRWRVWGDDAPYYDDESSDVDAASAADEESEAKRLERDWPIGPGDKRTGSLFAERGIYKLGEEVHLKGVLRTETPTGLAFPKPGATHELTLNDPRGAIVAKTKVTVSDIGSFDTVVKIPLGASQGTFTAQVGPASTSMLVAAYRKPDFVVDSAAKRATIVRGDNVEVDIDGRYLFGAPMAGAETTTVARWGSGGFGSLIEDKELRNYTYSFPCVDNNVLGCGDKENGSELATDETPLSTVGRQSFVAPTPISTSRTPIAEVTVESNVVDVSRQAFADRSTVTVLPGAFTFGVRTSTVNVENKAFGVDLVSLDSAGKVVAGKQATVELIRWDWVYANRRNDDGSVSLVGSYKIVPIAKATTVTEGKPVRVNLIAPKAGYHEVRVYGTDERRNWVESGETVYVYGDDFVSWRTFDEDPTLDLVADAEEYAPGQTAKILVKSPWPKAQAMLTVERNGVMSAQRVTLKSSASVVEIPIDQTSTPNTFATVTVFAPKDGDVTKKLIDAGLPQVLTATTSLFVPPNDRRLDVKVGTRSTGYLPGTQTKVDVAVKNAKGNSAPAEVTLWAVDEGVLRLTAYDAPNLLDSFYSYRDQQVTTADSRMRLLRTQQDEKGDGDTFPGGGGGEASSANGEIRKDFRTLAVYAGSVKVPKSGSATVDVKLPDSLTAYRIIGVAASGAEDFGTGTAKVEVRKPFMLQPALPRFVNVGDRFEAGVVVFNRTGAPGPVTVRVEGANDASGLVLDGPSSRTVTVGDKPVEVRFGFRSTRVATPKLVFSGALDGATAADKSDRVQASFPVTITQRLAVVATSGTVKASEEGAVSPGERLATPADALPGLGGLDVSVSSSSLAGLQNGVSDLIEYPYGCLEQRTSRIRVLLELAEVGSTFQMAGVPKNLKAVVERELRELRSFEIPTGGLSYWPGEFRADAFLSARTLILLRDAEAAGIRTPTGMISGLTKSLSESVGLAETPDESWRFDSAFDLGEMRSITAYALAKSGAPEPAMVDALYQTRFELPYVDQVFLLRAMLEAGETGDRPQSLFADLMSGVRVENTRAYVQSSGDYRNSNLYYLWSSDRGLAVRNTAALVSLLTSVDEEHPLIPKLSKYLVESRKAWGNTLEIGDALHALVDVSKTTEATEPDMKVAVRLGTESLLVDSLKGRSLEVRTTSIPVERTVKAGKNFAVEATGKGLVNWSARLRYAVPSARMPALDQGFTLERTYSPYSAVPGASGAIASSLNYKAGDLVRVTLRITTPQQRLNVAIDDPLPAGLEALNAQLTTTAQENLDGATEGSISPNASSSSAWVAGIDHTEIKDDRVQLFATVLEPGAFTYTYIARATAPGTFTAPPALVEEMYNPEVLGRTKAQTLTIAPVA